MKEACGVAHNLLLLPGNDQTFIGMAEVVVMVSEPDYRASIGGVERFRPVETQRFTASARTLRGFAEDFAKFADEVEALEARADGKQVQL